MIPIAPFIWIAIWLWQRSRKPDPNAPPVRQTTLTLRGAFLFCFYLFVYALLAPLAFAWGERAARALDGAPAWVPHGLGSAPTALLGLVLPPVVIVLAPRWLAWRVLRPLGWRRLAHAVAWFTLRLGRDGVIGLQRLLDVSLAARPAAPPASEAQADAWQPWARALEAARRGDGERVRLWLQADEPAPRRCPRAARVCGAEAVARACAERGDWPNVARAARVGRGRGVRLWRLLARAHLSGRVSRPALWLAWLSAPERRGLWRFVQAAPREQPAVVKTSTPVSAPWTRHVELLARASDGASLGRDDACALLAAWQERLQAPAEAAWRARAVELGDTNGERSWRAAQARIEGELLVLLESAPLTVDELGGLGELGARLALRVRDRLHADLAALIEAARPAQAEPDAPVEEWERWLMLRESVRRLEARAGFEAVRAAWHAGLRDVAWNRPCRVFNRHGSAAAQACYAMFAWTASLAKRLGEEEAARVNAENARIARRAA